MLHSDFSAEQLELMEDHGVMPFIAVFPLTEEGSWLMYTPQYDYTSNKPANSKMVFIPQGSALVLPGTTIHAGGFNSGNKGNPRIHVTLFLYDEDNEEGALSAIPEEFTSEWLGFKEKPAQETQTKENFHTFELVNWRNEPKVRLAEQQRKPGKKRKKNGVDYTGPEFRRPPNQNPNLDPNLYQTKNFEELWNFIGL